jgi:hypothetical protein
LSQSKPSEKKKGRVLFATSAQVLVPEAGLEPARSFQIEGFSCRTWSPRPTSPKSNVVDGLDYIISQNPGSRAYSL